MIGGNEEAFHAVKAVIQSFAKKLVYLGPVGSGHAVKAVNNTLLAAKILSLAEAMITLKSFDVPQRKLFQQSTHLLDARGSHNRDFLTIYYQGLLTTAFLWVCIVKMLVPLGK